MDEAAEELETQFLGSQIQPEYQEQSTQKYSNLRKRSYRNPTYVNRFHLSSCKCTSNISNALGGSLKRVNGARHSPCSSLLVRR
jgi:hypothetical protein